MVHLFWIYPQEKKNMVWSTDANKAYNDIKCILVPPQALMTYDPMLPLLLATDASNAGLGAILSHRLENGIECPMAYASRTITPTERHKLIRRLQP